MGDCQANCGTKPKQIVTTNGEEIKEIYNSSELTYLEKGRKLQLLGKYDEAIKMYNKSIKEEGPSAPAYTGLGNVCSYLFDYDSSQMYYNKAIDLDPQYKYAYNAMGNLYDILDNHESCIRAYQKAIKLDDQFTFPYNGLANFYYERHLFEDALPYYEEALKLDMQNPLVHANTACCLIYLKKFDRAFDEFATSKQLVKNTSNLSVPNRRYIKIRLAEFKAQLSKADPEQRKKFHDRMKQSLMRDGDENGQINEDVDVQAALDEYMHNAGSQVKQ